MYSIILRLCSVFVDPCSTNQVLNESQSAWVKEMTSQVYEVKFWYDFSGKEMTKFPRIRIQIRNCKKMNAQSRNVLYWNLAF